MAVFLYPVVMKKKRLPFTIGEQYDLNEFSVESIKEVIIGKYSYDVYEYIDKDMKSIFGFKVKSIQLFYNADILSKVKIQFDGNVLIELLNHVAPSENDAIFDNQVKSEIFYSPILDVTEFEYFDSYV